MSGEVREEIGADEVDAIGEPVIGDVALRDGERVGGDVDGVDVGRRVRVREQDGEAARARAQVERVRDELGRADVRRKAVRQQLGDERARNQHALVDVEAKFAEPRLVRQIGGRHALVDPAIEELRRLARARLA